MGSPIKLLCKACTIEKPIADFPLRVRDGRRAYARCKACDTVAARMYRATNVEGVKARKKAHYGGNREKYKANALKKLYGITLEAWNAMFAAQGGCCAICRGAEHRGRGWCTDHNHTTGKVREILCQSCNSMVGYARESEANLLAAIAYLKKHETKE